MFQWKILFYYTIVKSIICVIKIVIKYFTTTEIQLNMYNTDLTVGHSMAIIILFSLKNEHYFVLKKNLSRSVKTLKTIIIVICVM